jgi:AcrR family transcriptional regulator
MARVAGELGFTTMSLYRYVAGKEELLQLMWNASATGAETLVLEGKGWRERLRSWALLQREMLDRHPWITEMPMAPPPLAPNSLAFVERGLESLDDTGLADPDKLRIIGLISSYTLSESRMAHEAARAAAEAPADSPHWTFEGLLRELVDEETYPRPHRIAGAAGASRRPSPDEEREEFLFGLDRILDGVASLIGLSGERGRAERRNRAAPPG